MTIRSLGLALDAADAVALSADSTHDAVLAFDPDAHGALAAAGQKPITPWDFVQDADLPALELLDHSAQEHWRLAARAPYRGLDLFEVASFRHAEWLARFSWAAFVLARVLQALKPKTLTLVGDPVSHGLTPPPGTTHFPPLLGIARYLAESHACAVHSIARPNSAPAVPVPPEPMSPAAAPIPDGDYLLFYANHADVPRQLPLIRAATQQFGLPAIQVFKSADPAALVVANANGHAPVHEEELVRGVAGLWSQKRPPGAARVMAREALHRFFDARSLRPPVIFDNRHLTPHFDFLFGPYLEKMAWNVDLWRAFFAQHPPRLLVVSDQLPIAAIAADLGIPVLSLPHCLMVGDTQRLSRLTPTIGALTPRHRELLVGSGVAPDDVQVTGGPALPTLLSEATENRATAPRPHGLRRILVCTASLGMLAHQSHLPYVHWGRGLELIRTLLEWPLRHSGWRIVLKLHPRYDHAAAYKWLQKQSPRPEAIEFLEAGNVRDLAATCDAVVIPNLLSSAVIDASASGRPTFLMTGPLLRRTAREWAFDEWPLCESAADAEAALNAIFGSPTNWNVAAEQTRRALQNYLGSQAERGLQGCIQVMEGLTAPAVQSANSAGDSNLRPRIAAGSTLSHCSSTAE